MKPQIEFLVDQDYIFASNADEALKAIQEEYACRTDSDYDPVSVVDTACEDNEYPDGLNALNCDVFIVSEWKERDE